MGAILGREDGESFSGEVIRRKDRARWTFGRRRVWWQREQLIRSPERDHSCQVQVQGRCGWSLGIKARASDEAGKGQKPVRQATAGLAFHSMWRGSHWSFWAGEWQALLVAAWVRHVGLGQKQGASWEAAGSRREVMVASKGARMTQVMRGGQILHPFWRCGQQELLTDGIEHMKVRGQWQLLRFWSNQVKAEPTT